jgi:hypothetical protein
MKRRLNGQRLAVWVQQVGGVKEASLLIVQKLECSISKAEKIASGRYLSLPTPSEQKDLADLLSTSRDVLFPPARGQRAS